MAAELASCLASGCVGYTVYWPRHSKIDQPGIPLKI